MNLLQTIKENPLLVAGGVVILVLLMRGASGSGNSASSLVGASLQSQSLANDANVKLSGINAQSAVARAGYATDAYKAAVAAQTAIAVEGDKNVTQTILGYLSRLNTQDEFNTLKEIELGKVNAGATTAAKMMDAQVRLSEIDNNTKLTALSKQYEYLLNPVSINDRQVTLDKQYNMLGMITEGDRAIKNAQAKSINRSSKFGVDDVLKMGTAALLGTFTGGLSSMMGGLGGLFGSSSGAAVVEDFAAGGEWI